MKPLSFRKRAVILYLNAVLFQLEINDLKNLETKDEKLLFDTNLGCFKKSLIYKL